MLDLIQIVLLLYLTLGGLYWLLTLYSMVQIIRRVPRLDKLTLAEPTDWPGVTIIVAACNEEADAEHAARSLLAIDYPNLEVMLVDDRSTDRTGEILDRVAAGDRRAKVLHIKELPEGWLGKLNAMQQASRAATTEWLLFTDGDVHFEPQALRKAMSYAALHGLDHLCAYPGLWPNSLLLDSMVIAFLRQLGLALRLWKVNDPTSDRFMGVGAFNLVRRTALERAGGFEPLRMEVGDDAALGMILRGSGARQNLVNACTLMGLHWYRSVGQMARGVERGFASVGKCSAARTLFFPFVLLGLELSIYVGLLPLGLPAVQWIAAGLLAAFLGVSFAACRWAGNRFLAVFLTPLAEIVTAGLSIRAGILGWRRGGIVWRGTLYKSDVLKAGAKIRF